MKNVIETDGRLFISLNLSKEDANTLIKLACYKSMTKFQYPLKRIKSLKQNFKGDESLFEWDY